MEWTRIKSVNWEPHHIFSTMAKAIVSGTDWNVSTQVPEKQTLEIMIHFKWVESEGGC